MCQASNGADDVPPAESSQPYKKKAKQQFADITSGSGIRQRKVAETPMVHSPEFGPGLSLLTGSGGSLLRIR